MPRKLVAMVPARSGSRGLPDKNILELEGKPVIAYSIEPALDSVALDRTYINSDSDQYLEIGMRYGALPFKRPDRLASPTTSMLAVVSDFLRTLSGQGETFDAALVLYPTFPFRSAEQLERIVRFYEDGPRESSVIGLKEPETHPYLCAKRFPDGGVAPALDFDVNRYYRRQDYPEMFEFTAWALVVPFEELPHLNAQMFNSRSRGYLIPEDAITLDIDTADDFRYARFLMSDRKHADEGRSEISTAAPGVVDARNA